MPPNKATKGGRRSGTASSTNGRRLSPEPHLAPLGVEPLEMPVTPEGVWDAIRAAAQRGRAASQSCSGGTRAST